MHAQSAPVNVSHLMLPWPAAGADDVPLLDVEDVHVKFGGVAALDGASLSVAKGEICGIIGPNGAGKTTLFNAVSGSIRIDAGSIVFADQHLESLPVQHIVRSGVTRTFQNLGLYLNMTVLDNVLLGAHTLSRRGFFGGALRLPSVSRQEDVLRDRALALLTRLDLAEFAQCPVENLSYGTMKRVELARALITEPRLLLLDEPAGGLSPVEVDAFADLVRELHREQDLTVLLIEHHLRLVMSLCHHVVVLHLGKTLADGTPTEVANDPAVISAYLGTPK